MVHIRGILEKQKFRSCVVSVRRELLEKSSYQQDKDDDNAMLLDSNQLKPCSVDPLDEAFILDNLEAVVASKDNEFVGCIELLAVGGLVALNGKPVDAFLGSSIKPSKKEAIVDGDRITSKIFTKSQQQAAITTERLLRQYYKVNACNLWSFHLAETFHQGFRLINPLNVESHPSVSLTAPRLQSFIISCFARRQMLQDNLQALLTYLKGDREFLKKMMKVEQFDGCSFQALYKAMSQDGKWKDTMKILKMLEAGEISMGNSKKEIVNNKKMALSVGQRGFFKMLSDINDKNATIAKIKMSL
ncbi:hypothetical protein MBANPS3_009573 [Mucor bainieri]